MLYVMQEFERALLIHLRNTFDHEELHLTVTQQGEHRSARLIIRDVLEETPDITITVNFLVSTRIPVIVASILDGYNQAIASLVKEGVI